MYEEEFSAEQLARIAEWNLWAERLAIGLGALALLIVLGYLIRLISIKEFKGRYDYINKYEINTLWVAALVLIGGGAFFANSFVGPTTTLMIFVRAFITVSMSMIVGVIIQNLLKFYYPFYIEKRLKKLRYKPRISPKSGKAMKLLSEEEEDVYLDEGMQAEENVFSIDYDVWIDEETGYTQIEKYAGHLHALQCPECNYQTFKVAREEIVKAPTDVEEGELLKYMECGYCGHKAKRSQKINILKEGETFEASPAS